MYESPIKIFEDQLHNQIITDMENETMKVLMRYQIHVNKEELLKALKYDREQYQKGYEEGKRELAEMLVERLEELRCKPMELVYDVPLVESIIEIIKGDRSYD